MFAIIDHYAHQDSPLHRWHGTLKIVALLAAVVVIVSLHRIGPLLAGLAGCWALALATGVPARITLRRQRFVPLVAGAIFLAAWAFGAPRGGAEPAAGNGLPLEPALAALRLSLKLSAVLALTVALLATQPFFVFLESLRRLGVPARAITMLLLMSRYNLVLADRMQNMLRAARLRGYVPCPGPRGLRPLGGMFGSLVLSSLEQAERVEQAMRLRGFDGRIRASWPYRLCAADLLKFVGVCAGLTGLMVWEWCL